MHEGTARECSEADAIGSDVEKGGEAGLQGGSVEAGEVESDRERGVQAMDERCTRG